MIWWQVLLLTGAGGLWTFFMLLIGIGIGKAPYSPPRDARGLKQNG